jgi:hypothetical protein
VGENCNFTLNFSDGPAMRSEHSLAFAPIAGANNAHAAASGAMLFPSAKVLARTTLKAML